VSDDLRERLEAYLREQENRAFGNTAKISGRTLQPFSMASWRAAENLLAKALRWWRTDRERALRYVDRAVALPFDDHEEQFPAAAAAEMLIFERLTEEVEFDDGAWLEAAAVALEGARDPARFVLRDTLRAIDQEWELPERDRRRLSDLVGPIPPHPELSDMWELTPAELRDAVVAVLEMCLTWEDAMEQVLEDALDEDD